MKLKLKQLLSKIINTPLILEEGIVNNWFYRKWSDGRMEAWSFFTESYAITSTVANNQYYCNKVYDISALEFQSIHNILVTGELSGSYFGTKVEESSTTSITLSARASASQTGNLTHYVYIIGRWAELDSTSFNWNITNLSQSQMSKAEIQALIEGSGNAFKDNDQWTPNDLTV